MGYSNHSAEQKADRLRVMGKSGGVLDYVGCWFKLAAEYMQGTKVQAALVASNSITQGQQVEPLWKPLFDKGLVINFAHRSFVWTNDSTDAAHVHVVIVGFGYQERETKTLFSHGKDGEVTIEHPANINAYLAPASNVFISKRSKPLGAPTPMIGGGKPTDGGNLLLSQTERDELIAAEPAAAQWIKPFSMGEEFIKGIPRYCLWLVDCPPHQLKDLLLVRARVEQVREMRLQSAKAATQKKAATPWLFDEIRYQGNGTYIGVPVVSSERRRYIPMGFVTNGMIPGNKLFFVMSDSLYVFGVLMSRVHNTWMRAVAGRLEMRYSYANTIVYNTLIWPTPTDAQRVAIETAAQAVLDARAQYSDATLAELYDPDNDWLYPELTKAHKALDTAVERAYGLPMGCSEEDIVAHLFKLYAQATQKK